MPKNQYSLNDVVPQRNWKNRSYSLYPTNYYNIHGATNVSGGLLRFYAAIKVIVKKDTLT